MRMSYQARPAPPPPQDFPPFIFRTRMPAPCSLFTYRLLICLLFHRHSEHPGALGNGTFCLEFGCERRDKQGYTSVFLTSGLQRGQKKRVLYKTMYGFQAAE